MREDAGTNVDLRRTLIKLSRAQRDPTLAARPATRTSKPVARRKSNPERAPKTNDFGAIRPLL
jgi:hypothetical protein